MSDVRGWPLDRTEKQELEALLRKLLLLPRSGQIVIHINDEKISAVQPNIMIR